MHRAEWQRGADVSLSAVATILLRYRRRIVLWAISGGILAAIWVLTRPALFTASASFVPQGNDPGRSGLASLAGQFGVSLPSGNQSLSPEFYSKLLTSNVVLRAIARETFVVSEQGGRRVAFVDLFEIPSGSDKLREEQGVARLRELVIVSISKSTGVVEIAVRTPWRSVSLGIATNLLTGVNEYNERVRQGQAAAERKFIEGRLAVATSDLRAAEDRLEGFLRTNRQFGGSTELPLVRDRLHRDVLLRQQVFTSLTQAYEEARIREVRDTPVITVFEPPSVQSRPDSRGRLRGIVVGLLLGAFFGSLAVFTWTGMRRPGEASDAESNAFVDGVAEPKDDVLGSFQRWKERIGR